VVALRGWIGGLAWRGAEFHSRVNDLIDLLATLLPAPSALLKYLDPQGWANERRRESRRSPGFLASAIIIPRGES
jgi:hypothetical protein